MKLELLIRNYTEFLNLCCASLKPMIPEGRTEELFADWLQYHWELLVEQPLREEDPSFFLEFYGEGSENANGRVFMPEAEATHRICFRPIQGNELDDLIEGKPIRFQDTGLTVDRFVTCQPGAWFQEEPPFNAVLALRSNPKPADAPLVFAISSVQFSTEKILSL